MSPDKELQTQRSTEGIDFFGADQVFRDFLITLVPAGSGARLKEKLAAFSQKVSGPWNALADQAANNYFWPDAPRIEHFDRTGNRIDQIWLSPPVRQLRREVVEAGIFKNESRIEQFAKVYLLSHLGEVSVLCPLACTEGLIRAIEAVGSDFLKENYLPKLKSAETPLAGAQFITEMDMGSDVGALVTRATPDGDGRWRIEGEKWFCSAIDEYFLIAARPEGASDGTKGVAIFFVPRTIDGRLNNLQIKRLKNKLGTRELPTAEIELNGAVGYNIGPVEKGFKTLMNHVLDTSRLMNAASACGCMARALLEAENYARQRGVFGRKMTDSPLVQESLNKIRSQLAARRSLFFRTVAQLDNKPQKDFSSEESLWQRFLINLCKYRTAVASTVCVREAILLLGGNGTIETFSILPRLYRDSMVIETWEGTHNVLCLQILRDGLRFSFGRRLEVEFREGSERLRKFGLKQAADWVESGWKNIAPALERLSDPQWVGRNARRLVDHLGALLEVSSFPCEAGDLLDLYCEEISSDLRKFL